jgi:hypothetical protein
MIQQASHADLDELASPAVVDVLTRFLLVEDEAVLLQLLKALDTILQFAKEQENERWAEIHHQFFESDGRENLLVMTQEFQNQAFCDARNG